MEEDVEVRNLEGESITLSIPVNLSVADLKKKLRDSFPPATKSSNFHLFFKGCKLRLDSQIESHQIKNGEFIVLVPFTNKSQKLSANLHPSKENAGTLVDSQGSLKSPAADSTWHDLMNDLSSISDIPPDNGTPNNHCSSSKVSTINVDVLMSKCSNKVSSTAKRKRAVSSNPILNEILCSSSKDVFDQETSSKISRFVVLANCLSNSSTGNCLLFEEFVKTPDKMSRCACPSWLKKVLKSFHFLNIFYAFFQLQKKSLTWNVIDKALKHPCSYGLDDICISDVKNLSVLCPKVIIHEKKEFTVIKPGSAIVIDSSTESGAQHVPTKKGSAKQHASTIVIAVEKRWVAFRTHLGTLIRLSMKRRLSSTGFTPILSLEDILTSLKDGTTVLEHNAAMLERTRSSGSRCHEMSHLEPFEMVDHLRKCLGGDGQIVHVEDIDVKQATYVDFPNDLSDISRTVLKGIGISRLYSHQAEAIQASLLGKNVIVATSTSSGKSLCYNLPVLEALSKNLSACAIYIFPTKSLAQDQLRALLDLTAGLDVGLSVGVYDGDTSQKDRSWTRGNARLLITNPDMLHVSILPNHSKFQRILSNLRVIVIDETHVYKGAFGCHVALILRRLRRICSHVYGSDPSFIFCTATSANPREHAMELANLRTLELVQNDGSPCARKYFLLWNPPLQSISESNFSRRKGSNSMKSESCTRRSSPILEAAYLFAEMVQHGLRCITFCKTRKLSELVLCYTRVILQDTAPNLVDSICVYRGGYTPQDRRRIESEFFGGKLRGVAATNALELGIDVGDIDATLHLGFPGSIASLWQQSGRSGRRSRPSLAIYVAFEGPLDQYFMKFPQKLFKRPVEHCQVDGQNQKVLEEHIACAAAELPLCTQYDENFFGSGLESAIMALKNTGRLGAYGASSTKMWSYIGPEERPSTSVSIRAIETEKYKVVDQLTNEVLEEIEESKAFFQVYEGAVYMHQGFTYLVKSLDLSEKIAVCQKANLDYYTKTRDYTDIFVKAGNLAYQPAKLSEFADARTSAQVNDCRVTTKWFGFHRILKTTNQIYDTVELSLPEFSFESQAAWIRVSQTIKTAVEMQGLSFRAGLHAASHALLNVVPLYVMCNASDLSTECPNPHETRTYPERLLLYDKHPGGIGITAQIQLLFKELLTAALDLVSACSCFSAAGCPNCVQAFLCSEYNVVLDKKAAVIILEGVIERENSLHEKPEEVI